MWNNLNNFPHALPSMIRETIAHIMNRLLENLNSSRDTNVYHIDKEIELVRKRQGLSHLVNLGGSRDRGRMGRSEVHL